MVMHLDEQAVRSVLRWDRLIAAMETALTAFSGGRVIQPTRNMITIEEGTVGGFGSLVLHHLAQGGLLDRGLKIRPLVLPDRFIDHDKPDVQYDEAGLSARHITQTALQALDRRVGQAAKA